MEIAGQGLSLSLSFTLSLTHTGLHAQNFEDLAALMLILTALMTIFPHFHVINML